MLKMKPLFFLSFLSFLVFISFSCTKEQEELAPETKPTGDKTFLQVFAVSTLFISNGSLENYITLDGNIFSDRSIDIFPDTSGRIVQQLVNIGDNVRFNKILVRIDPSKPGLNYEPNPVRAPIAGTVTNIYYDIGSYVTPQSAILSIGDLSRLKIESFVSERYSASLKEGLKASLELKAYPGERFVAVIDEISPVFSTSTRSVRIELNLDAKAKKLAKAGMFTSLKLVLEKKKDILIIPSNALVTRRGKSLVYRISNESTLEKTIVEEIPVRIGLDIDEQTEILSSGTEVDPNLPNLSPLLAGDQIVIQGQTLLGDGNEVNIVRTQETK